MNDTAMKNVKVIACYFGSRENSPITSAETFLMMDLFFKKEATLDYGCPMDIIFVHNRPKEKSIEAPDYYNQCVNLLYSFNGKKMINGECIVVERENKGISFGAFDFAFHQFQNKYDFWMFAEDDQIIIKDGVMKQCIKQMTNYGSSICGFVAIAGVSVNPDLPVFAAGGYGVSHRDILKDVVKHNYSTKLKRGHLPYWYKSGKYLRSYGLQYEIPFTNAIYKLGYRLENIDMENVLFRWGNEKEYENNQCRFVPFSGYLKQEINRIRESKEILSFQDHVEIANLSYLQKFSRKRC
jgi:hypothetical protein